MVHAKQFHNIPQTPGVYMFKKGRVVLYIGKAANLRSRLRSYTRLDDRDPAKHAMVARADFISWEETTNDIEALLKEAVLIKRYRPKYNVLMRDDKNYSFVGFTKERFPKIFVTHQPLKVKSWKLEARYIGPFTDSTALKKTLRLLRRIFPYCVCKRPHTRPRLRPSTIARGFGGHACQYAQMGLCFGFCCQHHEMPREEKNKYQKSITAMRAILSGKRVDIARKLAKEMRAFSSARHFEEAANVRDQLHALGRIFAHRPFLQHDAETEHEKGLRLLRTIAKIPSFPHRIEAYDISHHHGKESVGSMAVFEEGKPAKSQYRKFIIRHVAGINDPAMIHEVLARRLNHSEWPLPDFILIDGGKPQLNAALLTRKDSTQKLKMGAIAKREEELYLPNKKPVALKNMPPPLLHLLQHLRDEAHRFAISFSKNRFRKRHVV